jgi:hypothetical protein
VNPENVQLLVLNNDVHCNEKLIPVGDNLILEHGDKVKTSCGELTFQSFSGGPYVGLMVGGKGESITFDRNATIEFGREPSSGGFALTDRKGQKKTCAGVLDKEPKGLEREASLLIGHWLAVVKPRFFHQKNLFLYAIFMSIAPPTLFLNRL